MANTVVFLGLLFFLVYVLEWAKKYKVISYLGSPVAAILAGALLSNTGVIPHNGEEAGIYGIILTYIAPAAIFLLLLQVNLRKLVDAGVDMLIIFALSVTGVVLGCLIFFPLIEGKIQFHPSDTVVAGILAAGHVGGSLNFNAVALHFDITKNANMIAALLTVDHIMIVFWMIVTVIIPKFQKENPEHISAGGLPEYPEDVPDKDIIDLPGIALLGGLVVASLLLSQWLSRISGDFSFEIPSILIISAIALVIAHSPLIGKIAGYDTVGQLFVYMFLIVIGAHTDFLILAQYGNVTLILFAYIFLILLVHAVLVIGVGRLFVKDLGIIALGSQACIGGPVSAAALAKSIGREDLTLPSVLVGSLGGAIGTFIGFAMIYYM
ncbi:MAG: DUF819 family protein [Gammaproteobacteria bacterium]